MRILFVSYMHASLPTFLRSFELARATASRGHDVVLAFLHPAFRPPAWFRAHLEAAGRPGFDIRMPRRSDAPARRDAPAHSSTPRPDAAAPPGRVTEARPSVAGLFRQAAGSLRYVPAERALLAAIRPDVVVARPDHVFSFVVSTRLGGVPLVLDTDGPVEELDHFWGIRSDWFRGLDAWRARRAAALLHVSRVTGDLWRAKGFADDRLFLCPNGADPEVFRPLAADARAAIRRRLGIEGRRVVGFSGNQRAWHGVGDLLRALAALAPADPDLRLLLVGSIEDRAALGLGDLPPRFLEERVVFTGAVPYAEMPAHLDAADLLALPYPALPLFHFSPMKLFEALALGKILVASRQGQVGDLLAPLPSACLYDPARPDGLREALRAALALQPAAGLAGRRLLESEHTWAHRGAVVEAACRRALGARDGGVRRAAAAGGGR